jgi:ABC-type thiamine transport system ATPase subunit
LRSAAAAGATVLIASHELDRAKAIAARTVTIAGGAIQPEPELKAVVVGAS